MKGMKIAVKEKRGGDLKSKASNFSFNTSSSEHHHTNRQTHLIFGQSSLIFVLITFWATICLPLIWSQFYIVLFFLIFIIFNQSASAHTQCYVF